MSKDFLKSFFTAGVPFGVFMGLYFGIADIYIGILAGITSGCLFGLAMSVIMQILKKKFKKDSLEITNGKKVILDGAANHFKGMEAVGGWLFLTSDEVIFKSHKFNIQTHETIIPLEQITEVKTRFTLGLVPNGLKIITINGVVEKFAISNRRSWINKINEAISRLEH